MSRKNGLKVRQDILAFIDGFTQERGYAPSVREIAKQVHLSLANVQYHLDVHPGYTAGEYIQVYPPPRPHQLPDQPQQTPRRGQPGSP